MEIVIWGVTFWLGLVVGFAMGSAHAKHRLKPLTPMITNETPQQQGKPPNGGSSVKPPPPQRIKIQR